MIEPVERGADVVDFARAVIMFSLTQSGSAKVEAQHGKTEAVQRLHGVKDNLVVQRSTEEGMGMTDNCSVCRILGSGVEDRFQASSRAFEEERPNRGVRDHAFQITGTSAIRGCDQ